MKKVIIRSNRDGDIWYDNHINGRAEALKQGVHTIVAEEDYLFLRKLFKDEIVLIKYVDEPKQEEIPLASTEDTKVEEVKAEAKKTVKKSKKTK